MRIKDFVDRAEKVDIHTNIPLENIINEFYEKKKERLYVVDNDYPVFVITSVEVIDILLNNKLNFTLQEYVNSQKPNILLIDANMHIIDTFNLMRTKRVEFAPVIENGKMIGEISFNTLSLKISFIAIKDPLTGTFNQKYFDVLIEEYNEIEKPLGIIMIKIENLSIFESLYGSDVKNEILKKASDIIKSSVRDVDFVFRNDDIFKIITFTPLEVTMKIEQRIKSRLNDLRVEDIKIPFAISATHIPELEPNIILAVEELERKLINWD